MPARTALRDGARALTYAQLDAASTRAADILREHGVTPGSLVGLWVERDVTMIVAMLGILKAGAGYLPIDPQQPAARVHAIIDDSRIGHVVTTRAGDLPQTVTAIAPRFEGDGFQRETGPGSASGTVAYAIYTSGSTGKPKGVVVGHEAVIRLFERTQPWFSFTEQDVWSMFHSLAFDFSVWEIWGALLHGGELVVVPYEVTRDPPAFHRWVAGNGVTVLSQTPSAFAGFDAADEWSGAATRLRVIVFGGEALPSAVLRGWVARHGDQTPQLVNMYGITETTVHVTYKRLSREDLGRDDVAIGLPIPDLRLHVLDPDGRPCADGVAGELYVEGPGLAQGYLHQPELTAERFPTLPTAAGAVRAYRSGDVVRRDADGDYAYHGRVDDQVKLRGYRIEPGEIRAALLRHPAIRLCHVGLHDYGEGDVRLVAYVVPEGGVAAWTPDVVRAAETVAAERLPDYMRPSAFVALDALPTTANGKIDRSRLPAPPVADSPTAEQALSTEERFVLELWRNDFGLGAIGLEDDFFDRGGTSLALIRSLGKVRAQYGFSIDLGLLSSGATPKALAALIRDSLVRPH